MTKSSCDEITGSLAEDQSPTSDPRFVAAPDKFLANKVDRLAESVNLFLQQCPASRTVTFQINFLASTPVASISRE